MVSTFSVVRRLLLCGACVLVGVVAASGQAPPEQRVDIDELKAAIDAGATMLLIDVREDDEVESGSIPGSIHIPLGQLEDRMSDIPDSLRYTAEHEYIRQTDVDNEFIIGITDYAQGELGDVVFVELPQSGDNFARMDVFGTIEAVKAVSDLYAPISGEIVEINSDLENDPALVNNDPYSAGWMVRVRAADPSELDSLMSASDYANHIDS